MLRALLFRQLGNLGGENQFGFLVGSYRSDEDPLTVARIFDNFHLAPVAQDESGTCGQVLQHDLGSADPFGYLELAWLLGHRRSLPHSMLEEEGDVFGQ
jgi:hypothetical protein